MDELRSLSSIAGMDLFRPAVLEWFRMTPDSLKDCNKKSLAQMAKEQGIAGWHAMRKDQLIRALTLTRSPATRGKHAPRSGKVQTAVRSKPAGARKQSALSPEAAVPARRPASTPAPVSTPIAIPHTLDHACQKDRIIVLARDPYWLHAYWELSRTTLARAQAALGQEWHSAQPILRLMDVTSEETTNATERHIRDIAIHGGVNNWYIDVLEPPRCFRIDIGYVSRRGRFYVLARSNNVTTPRAGVSDALEENWTDVQQQFERVQNPSSIGSARTNSALELRELFEQTLRHPLSSTSLQNLSVGPLPSLGRNFHFELDAELIVYGTTEPNAHVTLQGEPVHLRPDGSFTVRFSLPDSRQIIPAVASRADGAEERTIVLAVERNTKELEPLIHDNKEL
jgi:hypothetical protein